MKTLLATTFAAAVALAAPAHATDFTFVTTGGTSVNGTYGNARTFSATAGGKTITMTATGWRAVDANNDGYYDIQSAYLGRFAEGLGVTSTGDGNGNDNFHQIDNVDGVDFVSLEFDTEVTLAAFGRVMFGLPGQSVLDNDAAYKSTSATGALSNYYTVASDWTGVAGNGPGTNGWVSVAAGGASKRWLIGASFDPGFADGFKLKGVTVTAPTAPTAPVPEPATWAMMIAGFGLVGAGLRRRAAMGATAAA